MLPPLYEIQAPPGSTYRAHTGVEFNIQDMIGNVNTSFIIFKTIQHVERQYNNYAHQNYVYARMMGYTATDSANLLLNISNIIPTAVQFLAKITGSIYLIFVL